MVFGMDAKLFTAIVLGLFVIVLFIVMGRSWMRRVEQDKALGPLPEVPQGIVEREPSAAAEGMYVATTPHHQHLDRIMAHELGVRTSCRVFVYDDGVLFDRDGADPLWVAAQSITDFGTASGMVGKFVEKDGLVVLSWRFHESTVDTGLRTKTREGKAQVLAALARLTESVAKSVPAAADAPVTADPTADPDTGPQPGPDGTSEALQQANDPAGDHTGDQKETP